MWEDPIVKEVRRVRQEHGTRFGFDLEQIYRDLKRREAESGRTYVSYPPRQPTSVGARHDEPDHEVRREV